MSAFLFFFFFFFCRVRRRCIVCVCARMVAILHFETFVAFDFNPSLTSKMITDSDLDQIQ